MNEVVKITMIQSCSDSSAVFKELLYFANPLCFGICASMILIMSHAHVFVCRDGSSCNLVSLHSCTLSIHYIDFDSARAF